MSLHIHQLRAELRTDSFGIGTATPRLSWTVGTDETDWDQDSYELSLCLLTDGGNEQDTQLFLAASDRSVLVAWPFEPLSSRSRCEVRVRVSGSNDTQSEWSDPLQIEVGLLDSQDWSAVPITASAPEENRTQPIRLRHTFSVRAELTRARLYASALGLYQAECNGVALGDDVLAPGWTSYHHRLRYQTFDMTDVLVEGRNALGFTIAEGWYRGRLGWEEGVLDTYGDKIAAIAQLELTYADGTTQTVSSNTDWKAGVGPITMASIYDGEHFDARLDDPAWSTANFDDSDWQGTAQLPCVAAALQAPVGPAIKAQHPLVPLSISTTPSGKTLVDFGQNISGRIRIRASGEAGSVITMRHAEVLEHGEICVRPLRAADATDVFTLSGEQAQSYEPAFTIHGFRYAQIDGYPGTLNRDDIVAVPCYSDMEPLGTFTSSNADLNQLHSNVVWSMLGNFVDIPTDCPQRDERLGWTGDIQVFAPTASFLFNCDGFLTSWLQDLAAEQKVEGSVPFFVPWLELGFDAWPAAAWGDAAVIVPWVLYQRFGDVGILATQYESMTTWVDQVTKIAGPSHLWNTGVQFGDWLDPAAPPDEPSHARTDPALVATAHHAYTARLLGEIAGVLDKPADQERYQQLAQDVGKAFVEEYVTGSGRMASDAQTAYALALQFDLLPTTSQRERAGQRLQHLVQLEKYRIGTGFVGTPLMCDALANADYLDDAYFLLLQPECPSWLYPVGMGATTIWERWDSMLPDGSVNPGQMTSFNHYALGAVADFLHRTVAGLSPASPGYRKILVRPCPGGGLTSAAASHLTPYGKASVSWTRDGGTLSVEVVVPPSCRADIELPGEAPHQVGSGSHHFTCAYRPASQDPTEMTVIPGPFS